MIKLPGGGGAVMDFFFLLARAKLNVIKKHPSKKSSTKCRKPSEKNTEGLSKKAYSSRKIDPSHSLTWEVQQMFFLSTSFSEY
jgi:hypothetical protein